MAAERWNPQMQREAFFALPGEFAIALRDTVLRKKASWKERIVDGCDQNQESGVPPQEPLRILSDNGGWLLAETYYARGYVPAADVMRVQKESLRGATFLTVTGCHAMGECSGQGHIWFPMGVYLPLEGERDNRYLVRAATHGRSGAGWKTVSIAKTEDIVKGYLSYSPQAFVGLAKKQIGHLYDWGGRWGGLDCSALVMMLYRCFGIFIPRNSGQQAAIKNGVLFEKDMTVGERVAVLGKARPGDLLFMPGHVAIWLGKKGNMLHILHASYTAGEICAVSMNVTHKNAQDFLFKLEKIERIP